MDCIPIATPTQHKTPRMKSPVCSNHVRDIMSQAELSVGEKGFWSQCGRWPEEGELFRTGLRWPVGVPRQEPLLRQLCSHSPAV